MTQKFNWFEDCNPTGCRLHQKDGEYILYVDPESPCVWDIRKALCLMGLKQTNIGYGENMVYPDEEQLEALTEFFGQSF